MVEPTRKRREIARREDLFLDIARRLLLRDGYHGLTMARVAAEARCAKGTTYLRFSCKEEMIVRLVARGLERRLAMMERGASFDGRPRERLMAVGEAIELFARLYPDDLRIFYISNTEAITQKASDQALLSMRRNSHRTFSLVAGLVRDGVECGDLTLPKGTTPEDVAFCLRAFVDGAYGTVWSWMPPSEMGIADPLGTGKEACEVLCDGYGWRPLRSEWDYERTRRRVWREVFPGESDRAASAGPG